MRCGRCGEVFNAIESLVDLDVGKPARWGKWLVLAGFALLTEGRIPRPQTGSEWGTVSGLAMTGIFLYALCFFYGLHYINASRASLIVAIARFLRASQISSA